MLVQVQLKEVCCIRRQTIGHVVDHGSDGVDRSSLVEEGIARSGLVGVRSLIEDGHELSCREIHQPLAGQKEEEKGKPSRGAEWFPFSRRMEQLMLRKK